jgi:hypothetical protein
MSKGIIPAGISKDQGHVWSTRPKEVAEAVSAMIQLDPIEALRRLKTPLAFPVWKTIRLGTYKKAAELRQAMLGGGFKIGSYADDLLTRRPFAASIAKSETEIDLVLLTVADLGFPNSATRAQIYEKARALGLELCPAEAGPQLRLQYLDQPNGEWIYVAMEPITDSHGDLKVFHVVHYDRGQWLYGPYGYPDYVWSAENRWVFRRK